MHYSAILFVLSLLTMTVNKATAQAPKRPLKELINTTEPAWPLVQEWIKAATNQVEVLEPTAQQAKETLLEVQVTTRSPMGAIILNSGGILVDHGWIRILGSGNTKMKRTLHTWNFNKTFDSTGQHAGYLLVADDAIGGYYAINGGALGKDVGKAYYLDPATLTWEALELSYSQLIVTFFSGDLPSFYKDLRWKNWENEIADMTGDEVINCYPMLFTKEGRDINTVSRKSVPVEEQWTFTYDVIQQLNKAK